jgi:ABC-type glycerol-3-phosphate transport system permease component
VITVNSFNRSSRNVVDIIDIQRNIVKTHKYSRAVKKSRIIGLILAFACIVIFFLSGYAIAALSIPMFAKVLIFALIALVGLVPGYIVAVMFH